jgi:hypothetical protein
VIVKSKSDIEFTEIDAPTFVTPEAFSVSIIKFVKFPDIFIGLVELRSPLSSIPDNTLCPEID